MSDLPTVLGFDTETFRGGCKLLACSNGRYTEASETETLLDFLYGNLEEAEAVYGVFWNLGFDFATIAKPYVVLHAEELRKQHYRSIAVRRRLAVLQSLEETEGLKPKEAAEMKTLLLELDGSETIERFDTDRFHVRYVGGKGVGLKPRGKGRGRKKTRWLFDAAAFYTEGRGSMKLDTASQRFLGDRKSDVELGIDRERLGEEEGYYEARREVILPYCIKDADLTRRLMLRTIETFYKLGYPFPDHPFSKGSVSKALLEANGCMDETQKTYEHLDRSASRGLWNKAFQGGVFLLKGVGHWKGCYQLDIISAYPDALLSFPSLEGAELVERDDPRFKECFFRFYKVKAPPTPRLPLKERRSLRKIYGYDREPRTFFLTGPDLETLDLYGDPYEIVEAVGIVTDPMLPRPFAWIENVFEHKDRAKREFGGESVEYWNLKIVANGTYGCVAQRRPRPSRFTNLIYASYTTALCRLKLWKKIRELENRGDFVLQYATDGLLVEDRTGALLLREQAATDSRELGAWSFESLPPVTLFETGVSVLHYEPKPKLKLRGFPDLTADVLQACNTPYWESGRKAPVKLKTAIIQRRAQEIGRFLPTERVLNPAKAVRDAGMSAPADFWTAPLSDYFRRHWYLKLRGES